MHEVVLSNVFCCWKTIADCLGYLAVNNKEINEKEFDGPYNYCAEFMEDWLGSDQSERPKDWQKISLMLNKLLVSGASSVEQCLLKKGLLYKENKCTYYVS